MKYNKIIKNFINDFDNHKPIEIPRIAPDSDDAPAQHLWIATWMVEYLRLFMNNLSMLDELSPEEYVRYHDEAYDNLKRVYDNPLKKYGEIIGYNSVEEENAVKQYVSNIATRFWVFGNYLAPSGERYIVTKP